MNETQLKSFLSKNGIRRNGNDLHAYWPNNGHRPHFHLTSGYIGTDSFNLIGRTKKQI